MRCALIGLGMVADTHVAALRAAQGVTLAGVMGRDPAKAAHFAQRHEVPQVYQSVQDVAASEVDFVIIATPPDARADLVRALVAGRKPILMEKPLERSFRAAHALVEMCEVSDLPLGVVLQHRTRAVSQALRDVIRDGTLGEIAHVDIRVPWWRDQGYYDSPGRGTYARDGGGVMITQAIHTLDLALWCLGPVASVQAMMATTPLHRLEAEDWAAALMRFESGAIGNLSASTAAYPGGAESITVQGTKAAAHLEGGVLRLRHLDGREGTFGDTASSGGGADPMAFTHEWHQAVIEDFMHMLVTGHPPLASGRSALQVHAVIDAMQIASDTGARQEVSQR